MDVTLGEELGRGGMGIVHAGVLRGAPVVVKTLPREDEGLMRALASEARALAALHHPNVARVLDFGRMQGRTGAPYLVMTRAPGVPLSSWPEALSWRAWLALMRALLDALAHLHARGVLHRDIKPSNIMVARAHGEDDAQGWASVVLIDLGVAALRVGQAHEARGGTPLFMAPEQLGASGVLPEGPWTDLYALGCTAYALLAGRPPWQAPTVSALLAAKLDLPPAPLPPPYDHTPGLAAWLGRLLARDPRDRFRRAADALRELDALAEIDGATAQAAPARGWGATTGGLFTLGEVASVWHTAADPLAAATPEAPEAPGWRRAHAQPTPTLTGARLGRLRHLPLTGFEAAREVLWTHLLDVLRLRHPALVVLDGPAGAGKSALASWCAERAEELGLADALGGAYAPHGPPLEGWTLAIADSLTRLGALGQDEALEARVAEAFLSPPEAPEAPLPFAQDAGLDQRGLRARLRQLAAHLGDDPDEALPTPTLGALLADVLGARAAHHPVIVTLDDAQHMTSAQDWAQLWARLRGPALVLLTTRSAEAPARVIETLRATASAWLTLDALSAPERAHLARAVLADEAHLERLSAHPITRPDALVEAAHALGEGDLDAPADAAAGRMAEIARRRLERALHLAASDAQDRQRAVEALRLCCALGDRVPEALWTHACQARHIPWPEACWPALIRAGLLRREEDRWRVEDRALRDALGAEADAHDHRACAEALGHERCQHVHSARVVRHLLASGQLDAALQLIDAHMNRWPMQTILTTHDAAARAFEAAQDAGARDRIAELHIRTVEGLLNLDAPDALEAMVTTLNTLKDDPALSPATRAHALEQLAWHALYTMRHDEGVAFAEGALKLMGEAPALWFRRCTAWRALANLHIFRDAPADAMPALTSALAALDDAPEHHRRADSQRAWARYEQALAASELGALDEAEALATEGMARQRALGDRPGEAACMVICGEVLALRGELDAAISTLERAARLYWDAHDGAWLMTIESALELLLHAARWSDARAWCDALDAHLLDDRAAIFEVDLRSARLTLAAAAAQWASFDALLAQIEAEPGARVDDLLRVLHLSSERARAQGQRARAERVDALISTLEQTMTATSAT